MSALIIFSKFQIRCVRHQTQYPRHIRSSCFLSAAQEPACSGPIFPPPTPPQKPCEYF